MKLASKVLSICERTARSILIVDDEEDLVELLEMFLSKPGRKLDTAFDFNAASKLLSKNNYDAILVDRLKGMKDGYEGFELAKIAKDKNKNCQTILITGDDSIRKHELFDKVIHKPFDFEELKKEFK